MRLPGGRYEEIKAIVAGLFQRCGCDSIPVDPVVIAEQLGCEVVPYSSLGVAGEAAAVKRSMNGFTLVLEKPDGTSVRRIYYNDRHPLGRQRFTLLHEIGHVVLGHLQESDVAEAEANFFAKFAIAPPSLVYFIQPADYMDIAAAFGLSSECALNSWDYYQGWMRAGGGKAYERILSGLFVVSFQTKVGKGFHLRGCGEGGGRIAC